MGNLARHGRSEAIATAPTEALWHIITDVTRVGEWSHECRAAHWGRTGSRAGPGVRFRGTNRSGPFVWSRSCMFIAVDPPRSLVWKTVGLWGKVDSTVWQIDLEPAGTGTRIVQTYDVVHVVPGLDRVYWLLVKAHRDRRNALADDLQRLAKLAENAEPIQAS